MKKSIRFLFMIIVLMLVFTVIAPAALCENGDETTQDTDTTEATDTADDAGTTDDTGTADDTAATDDTGTADEATTDDTADTGEETAASDFEMLMLDSAGTDVIRIQMRLRDLGYISYRATGMYYSMTEKAVKEFQQNNGLDPDGRVGEITYEKLFSTEGLVRKPLSVSIVITSGPSLVGDPTAYGELADWSEVVDAAFPVGTTATITDFNTGETFEMTRTGGVNHANVETADADDYNTFLNCFGGDTIWEKRSVIVTIGESAYAASLLGYPDGEDTIADNGMEGHTQLYFYGSCSDIYGLTDKEHEKMVLRAAGKELTY